MYLAPLNADFFFKKVFSKPPIAQKFLEDFFDIKIETLELMNTVQRVTNDSAIVAFDFRCKANGEYFIIDMQQWYKSDVVKRFYLYHAVSTVLQLEEIPMKSQPLASEKVYESKDYRHLLPVITLIWMADDSLKFKEDFVSFSLFPEQIANFVNDETLWAEPIDMNTLLQTRRALLEILNNKNKQLDFLPQNRLIFAFQKNIVRNKKYSKYFDWFEFAEKTQDKNNTVEDFLPYSKSKIFMEIIRQIEKTALPYSEFKEIEDYDKFLIQYQRFKDGWIEDYLEEHGDELRETLRVEVKKQVKIEVKEEVKAEVKEEMKAEVKEEVKAEVKEEVKAEVKEEVKAEVKEEVKAEVKEEVKAEVKEEVKAEVVKEVILETKREAIKSAYKRGILPSLIADVFGLPIKTIETIIASDD